MSLSSAALRRPVTTIAATMTLVLLGAVSISQMPVSLLPDVTLPVLAVRTVYKGAAAEEVSRFVAEPIEKAIGAIPGLTGMRSVSRNGEDNTTLQFAWGTDMAKTVLAVREHLDNASTSFPTGVDRPTLLTSDPGERPIAVLALTGPGDLRAIARTGQDVHARRLEQIAGVASVAVVGDPTDEIRVDVDPDRARALGITPDDVATAISNANAIDNGGTVRRGQFRFSVRTLTELQDPAQIRDVPVGPAAQGIKLSDIATVTPASADPRTVVRLDGKAAIGLVVYKDAGSNTVAVTAELQKTLDLLAKQFPDVHVRIVAAQAKFVSAALSNLWQEIVVGGILSILIIVLFLRDVRMSLAIGVMVPLSVFVSLTLMQLFHVTINIFSLGGLALAVGMLVDNSIVVAEATERGRDLGEGTRESARVATDEVAAPLIAGTLTTALVFGPIVFVQGLSAALFRDLSISVVVTLMASLVLALTLMPVLTLWGRKKSDPVPRPSTGSGPVARDDKANAEDHADERWRPEMAHQPHMHALPANASFLDRVGFRLTRVYEVGLTWSLRYPGRVIAMAVVCVAFTVYLLVHLPREILPQVDEGSVTAELRLPPATAIEETIRQAGRLQAAAASLGSVGTYARIGSASDEEVLSGAEPGSPATAMFVFPVPHGTNAPAFADRLRRAVPDLAQGALAIDLAGQSEFGSLIGREGRTVRVEVSAQKDGDAERAAAQVRAAVATVPDLADVRDAFTGTEPIMEVSLLRDRIARRGLPISAVLNSLQGALGGVQASDLRETDRRTPIRVRYAGSANENLQTALASTVQGVPLGELVSVEETRAPVEVVRVDQRPVSVVEAVVERGGTARASDAVDKAVSKLTLAPGVEWQITGADQEQRKTTKQLSLVAVLSAALMFLVLAGEFSSFTSPLIIMTTVPIAGAGSVILLWLTGQSLNAVSLIGIVVMIGMADNEAVVKLDAIHRYRDLGYPIDEAVLRGGHKRLRAITMTTFTAIAGVIPLVLNLGSGGALYQPLGAAVLGGSVTQLAVTFFLMPALYAMIERSKARKTVAVASVAEPA
ncbi:MAG TPA: efflux RND transporter permease subunit [Gemmatimonadales bacterium]|jgi:HAE1 family hydrophobic/amphiphilic exporter-1